MGCWHSDVLSRRHDVFCRVFALASQSVSNIVYIHPEAGLYQFPIHVRWHFPQYYMQQSRSLALGKIQWCAVNIRENPVIHFTIKPGQHMAWQKTMISNGCGCHAVDGPLMGRSWLIWVDLSWYVLQNSCLWIMINPSRKRFEHGSHLQTYQNGR